MPQNLKTPLRSLKTTLQSLKTAPQNLKTLFSIPYSLFSFLCSLFLTGLVIKDKEDEINRLKSMNATVSAMSTALKLVVLQSKVKQLDIRKFYYDDNDNIREGSGHERPIDKKTILNRLGIGGKEITCKQYYGIIEKEFTVEGSIDLQKIEICEGADGAIYFSGINPSAPQRIEPRHTRWLNQIRTVKFRIGKDDPKVIKLIEDPSDKGIREHEDAISNDNTPYKFDDETKKFIEKSAESFIKLFLAPFGKPTVYRQTMEEVESTQSLLGYFKDKIDRIAQERSTVETQLKKLEAEHSEHVNKLFG